MNDLHTSIRSNLSITYIKFYLLLLLTHSHGHEQRQSLSKTGPPDFLLWCWLYWVIAVETRFSC